MTTDVAFVESDATMRDVARLLIEKSISAAPVLEAGKPVGMIRRATSPPPMSCAGRSAPNGGSPNWRKASRWMRNFWPPLGATVVASES
ncbi:CBS domain-containing protein [Methylocystis iwaonis]|uniref:CBS domain-containing protein n=1 Tax=Methylocystis iwaonis TaxID=2885079 RepID=UPI002E7AFA13|nr:CBS domain-containing protein [Methylocystis iwaonis]